MIIGVERQQLKIITAGYCGVQHGRRLKNAWAFRRVFIVEVRMVA